MICAVLWMLLNVLLLFDVSGVGSESVSVSVSVMEGDSVTLYSGTEANQQKKMRWYFKTIQITIVTGDQRKICAEDECKERFRDRLKLDQTGSLTITDTRNTDSGVYQLKIINNGNISVRIFSVSVHDDQGRDKMKIKSVKEGESVVLDPGAVKNLNDVMRWYFNFLLIAEMTGDQRKICADDQCKERFRDRLKLDQTGSLIITDINNTDSGEYKLHINNSSFSINRISAVLTVMAVAGSGLSPAAVTGIIIGVVLLIIAAVAAVFIYKWKKTQTLHDQENPSGDEPHDQNKIPLIAVVSESNGNPNETCEASKNSVSNGH